MRQFALDANITSIGFKWSFEGWDIHDYFWFDSIYNFLFALLLHLFMWSSKLITNKLSQV